MAALAVLLLCAFSGPVLANPIDPAGPNFDELRANVRAELDKRGIPETDIRLIDIKARLGSQFTWPRQRSRRQVVGYDAWVRLRSCEKGYVVVTMNRFGFVQQAYGHGACDPPGF